MYNENLARAMFLRACAFAMGGVLIWLLLGADAAARTVRVTYVNNYPVPMEIFVRELEGQGDCCEGYYQAQPGQSLTVPANGSLGRTYTPPLNVEESFPVLWRLLVEQLQYPDAVLVGNSYVGGGLEPTLVQIADGALPIQNSTPQNWTFVLPPGRQLNPDAAKTLWREPGTELNAKVFREGIDKIIAFQKTPGSTEGGGAGGSDMPNTEATHTAAKQANELVDFTDLTPNASKAAMQSSGDAAGLELKSIFGEVPTAPGYEVGGGSAPDLTVSLPATFGGGVFDFNPFGPGRLGEIASWFRTATAWLVLATLGVWVWSQLAEWVRGFSTMRQAHGNPVVLGTGAQATALAAAGLMTVAVVVAATALVSWTFGDINVFSLVTQVTTNPLATMPAGALWMLDQVFPLATMITALVARLTFNMYASGVFAVCMSVVRFVVP